jgi:hypothetical protein
VGGSASSAILRYPVRREDCFRRQRQKQIPIQIMTLITTARMKRMTNIGTFELSLEQATDFEWKATTNTK